MNVDLLILLAGAALLRLSYFTGMVRGDAFNYAHAANELSQGYLDFGAWDGSYRIGLYAPVALLYRLFGVGDFTTLAFPFIASLLLTALVYILARRFAGPSAALIAGALWAFFPLDIHLATQLLADVPVTAISLFSVLCLFKSQDYEGGRKLFLLILTVFFLIWAILVKPTAVVLIVFYTLGFFWRWSKRHKQRISEIQTRIGARGYWVIGIALLILVIGYGLIQPRVFMVTLANTAANIFNFLLNGTVELDFSSVRFTQSSLLVYLGPLLILAWASLFSVRNKQYRNLLLWLSVFFLYFEWGTVNTNPLIYVGYDSHIEARSLLVFFPPVMIAVGAYLQSVFGEGSSQRTLLLTIFVISTSYAVLIRTSIFAGEVPGILFSSFALSVLLTFLLPIINVYTKPVVRSATGALLFGALLFASLRPALPYHAIMFRDRIEELEAYREVASYLSQEQDGYVSVANKGHAIRLNYASYFDLGYDWSEGGPITTPHIVLDCQFPEESELRFVLGSPGQCSGFVEPVNNDSPNLPFTLYRLSD